MFNISKDIGSENAPTLKVLLTFSVIPVVNSKLPCVSHPPSTVCKPTMLSEKVPAPFPGLGG
jgi:hypothetical protein